MAPYGCVGWSAHQLVRAVKVNAAAMPARRSSAPVSVSLLRRWISALAFFAIVVQILCAPAGAAPPPVNLLLQLSAAGAVRPDMATVPREASVGPTARPPSAPVRHGD